VDDYENEKVLSEASMGKPSKTYLGKQLQSQKHLLDSPAFKKWFGNSVVRNKDGSPMMVYHGTCRSGFTKFDPTKTREMGFHFGTWSQSYDFVRMCEDNTKGDKPGVYPVYLSIQNALETPDIYSNNPDFFRKWIESTNEKYKWFSGEKDEYYRNLKMLRDRAAMANYKFSGGELTKVLRVINKKIWNQLKKVVMRKGYDGIKYRNQSEGKIDDPNNIAWVVFSPAQVKSATENSGAFNRRDPDLRNPQLKHGLSKRRRVMRKNPLSFPPEDITYAALTPTPANTDIAAGKTLWETPAFKKWFGDSKVRDLASRPAVLYHGTCSSGFTKFDPTKTREMGFHFGTSSQAKDFLKGCGTYRGKTPGIYPVYLSIQNPLFTPDVYSESPTFFIEWLEKTNHTYDWFTDEDDSYYRSLNKLRSQLVEANLLTGEGSHGYRQKIFKTVWGLLRKIVMRKGYDGIRYKNENEGNTDDPYNMAWIAFSPAQVKSATENRGTFNRRDPDLRNPMITNPMDPRSAMTQIAGTKKTYAKAAKMLGGKVLDYGAGLGIGTDILRAEGLLTDSFEPYPEKWKGKRPPTYTDSAKIPSSSYDSLVSFSVINVVEPDMRKFLFEEVARILRSGGIALITGRDRNDVEKATIKIPHLEEGGYLIDEGEDQRYQKGFTQKELEQYAKRVLGPDFTVQKNGSLNGASIKITKGKTNPVNRSMIRSKLSRIIEPGDRVLDYDRAQGEDLYRLWDLVHTDMALTPEALVEIEGMLDDDGVLVIQSGEEPAGLRDHFRRVVKYQGMLLVQGPMNPEEARINTEKLRRDLE
jgi:SAM-dependent methyltransferase